MTCKQDPPRKQRTPGPPRRKHTILPGIQDGQIFDLAAMLDERTVSNLDVRDFWQAARDAGAPPASDDPERMRLDKIAYSVSNRILDHTTDLTILLRRRRPDLDWNPARWMVEDAAQPYRRKVCEIGAERQAANQQRLEQQEVKE